MTRTFRRVRSIQLLCCLTLLGLIMMSPGALAQQRVGVNSAVNPEAMGLPPGGLPRRLVLGQDVVFNERITTQANGQNSGPVCRRVDIVGRTKCQHGDRSVCL